MKKMLIALVGLNFAITSCSSVTNNPNRKIASEEKKITAAEMNARQKLNDFTNRYAGDSEMLKSIIDAAIASGITQEFGRDTGIPLTDAGINNLFNSWEFLGKDLKPLQPVVLSGEGMYFDFSAADELAMKLANKRILEIFASASVELVKLHVATQYRRDWDRPYKPGFRNNVFQLSFKKLISMFATVDDQLASAMLACETVACAKHLYDAQAELLDIGAKLDKKGYSPDRPDLFHFNHAMTSAINKEAIRMLSLSMPQSNLTEKLYRQALNIFIRPIFVDTDLGDIIHKATIVDVPPANYTGLKVETSNATLANEIKVLQYTFTRLQYSIIHNEKISHSPSAFDYKRPYGMLLTCLPKYHTKGVDFMAIVYGQLAPVECTDVFAKSKTIREIWHANLKKYPSIAIADLADAWIARLSSLKFAESKAGVFAQGMKSNYRAETYIAGVKIFGVGAYIGGGTYFPKGVLIMISGVRPLVFTESAHYAGVLAGFGAALVNAQLGVLGGVSKNTAGSVAVYAGGGIVSIGAFAGIGWLQIDRKLGTRRGDYYSEISEDDYDISAFLKNPK